MSRAVIQIRVAKKLGVPVSDPDWRNKLMDELQERGLVSDNCVILSEVDPADLTKTYNKLIK